MPTDLAATVLQIAVGLGGAAGLASLLMLGVQKRKMLADTGKTSAEADSVLAEAEAKRAATEIGLIDPYERVMTRLQRELDRALDRVDVLTARIEQLCDVIRAAGLPVPPMPHLPPVSHHPRSDPEEPSRT